MANNHLILRNLNSPWVTPVGDVTKGSVLSWADMDNNFIYLRGEVIYTADTSGNTITLKKINGDEFSFNIDSSGTTLYIEVSYTELTNLISTSGLSEGSLYLINDYQTIYIQPDYYSPFSSKPIDDSMIKTGGTEPIVVLATSNNTLSINAWSILFPNDTLEYVSISEDLYSGNITKGKIIRRKDIVGNDFPFDFRKVKFKRYKSFNGPIETMTVFTSGSGYSDGIAYVDDTMVLITTLGGQITSATLFRNYGGEFEVGATYSVTQNGGSNGIITVTSIYDDDTYYEFYRQFYDTGLGSREYTVFGTESELDDDTYQIGAYNNVIEYNLDNTYNIWFYNTIMSYGGYSNNFSKNVYNNTFYYKPSSNLVVGVIKNSLFMNSFENNQVYGEIEYVRVLEGDEVNETCKGNVIKPFGRIYSVAINAEFYGNIIEGDLQIVDFKSMVNSKIEGLVAQSGSILNSSLKNVYNGTRFIINNCVLDYFVENYGSDFYGTEPLNLSNCIFKNWNNNDIMGNVYNVKHTLTSTSSINGCQFGSYSNPYNAPNITALQDLSINIQNTISTINFETATLIITTGNKEIITLPNGNNRLMYVDNIDSLIITDITD